MHEKTLTRAAAAVMLIASTLLTTAPIVRAGLAPEQQCQKSRYDAATKYAQCHGKALAKLFATNDLTKMQPALSKCRVKYTETYVKIQKKAAGTGSTCDSPRFVDTGNGTVVDNLTGLEWEQKTDDGAIHDKDTTYTWYSASDTFLEYGGTTPPPHGLNQGQPPMSFFCFVSSPCNWRLPTLAELQTILSEPFPCTTSPCIPAIFGPTTATDYWSSTTLADNTTYAWGVFFGTGEVSYGVKLSVSDSVRAVRGGL